MNQTPWYYCRKLREFALEREWKEAFKFNADTDTSAYDDVVYLDVVNDMKSISTETWDDTVGTGNGTGHSKEPIQRSVTVLRATEQGRTCSTRSRCDRSSLSTIPRPQA